jgi:hypothetical protein
VKQIVAGLKQLQEESTRLKSLGKAILQDIAARKWSGPF